MPHWSGLLIIAVIVLLVFGGRGKISSIMGDLGKGINSFKTGLKDNVEDAKDAAEDALDVTPKEEEISACSRGAKAHAPIYWIPRNAGNRLIGDYFCWS
jgi:sec-independent protein translocase protein TatA